jgi:hypothetical protein
MCAGTAGVGSLSKAKQRRDSLREGASIFALACRQLFSFATRKQQERAVVAGDHEAACRPLHTLPPPPPVPPSSSFLLRRLFLSLPLSLPGSPPGSSDVPSAAPAVPIDMDGESGDVSCGATAAPLDRRLPGASVESPEGDSRGWWWGNSSPSSGRGEENIQRQYLGSHVPHAQASLVRVALAEAWIPTPCRLSIHGLSPAPPPAFSAARPANFATSPSRLRTADTAEDTGVAGGAAGTVASSSPAPAPAPSGTCSAGR